MTDRLCEIELGIDAIGVGTEGEDLILSQGCKTTQQKHDNDNDNDNDVFSVAARTL